MVGVVPIYLVPSPSSLETAAVEWLWKSVRNSTRIYLHGCMLVAEPIVQMDFQSCSTPTSIIR